MDKEETAGFKKLISEKAKIFTKKIIPFIVRIIREEQDRTVWIIRIKYKLEIDEKPKLDVSQRTSKNLSRGKKLIKEQKEHADEGFKDSGATSLQRRVSLMKSAVIRRLSTIPTSPSL